MRRDIVTSVIGIFVLTILLGLVYPLVITGVSQVAFPGNSDGQQIHLNGKLIGSKIIGQSFASPVIGKNGKCFRGKRRMNSSPKPTRATSPVLRPSATEGGAYNAAASTFSNRGPNSVKTEEANAENIKAYLELNKPYDPNLTVARIPVDAVNTSGSNLDPEISQANAWIQAHRIAAKRGLSLARVNGLIGQYTSGRGLGFSGEPGVNVLELNLALDRASAGGH